MKLKIKITLLMLAVALIPLLIATSIVLYSNTQQVQISTLELNLNQLKAGANELSGYFEAKLGEVNTIANTPVVKSMNWTNVQPYFTSEVIRHNGVYEKMIISLPDGSYYSATKDSKASLGNPFKGGKVTSNLSNPNSSLTLVSGRDYWQKLFTRNTEKKAMVYVSEPVISLSTGVKQILVLSTIMDDKGQLIGAVQGGLPWTETSREVAEVKKAISKDSLTGAKVALVAKEGEYIDHWDQNKIVGLKVDAAGKLILDDKNQPISVTFKVTDEASSGLAEAGKRMIKGDEGYRFYTDAVTGQEMAVIYAPVKSAGYSFLMVVPKDEILAPVKKLTNTLLMLAMLCAVFAVLIGFLAANYVVMPLISLTRSGRKIADGDLNVELEKINTNDEIKDLSQTIEMLVNAIKFLKKEEAGKKEVKKK